MQPDIGSQFSAGAILEASKTPAPQPPTARLTSPSPGLRMPLPPSAVAVSAAPSVPGLQTRPLLPPYSAPPSSAPPPPSQLPPHTTRQPLPAVSVHTTVRPMGTTQQLPPTGGVPQLATTRPIGIMQHSPPVSRVPHQVTIRPIGTTQQSPTTGGVPQQAMLRPIWTTQGQLSTTAALPATRPPVTPQLGGQTALLGQPLQSSTPFSRPSVATVMPRPVAAGPPTPRGGSGCPCSCSVCLGQSVCFCWAGCS